MNVKSPHGPAFRDLKHPQDRQRHLDSKAAFFGFDRSDAIPYMLPTEPHSIATTKAGVEQNVQPNSLPGPNTPSSLVSSDMLLGPRDETAARLAFWIFNAKGWISL
jgi:hypothetical protein